MNNKISILGIAYDSLQKIVVADKNNILFLLYYSFVEAILLMVSPLTSAFIINSVLAHATISIYVLSFIVIIVFMMISTLQVLKEYMIEKFEQKIFVESAINISDIALKVKGLFSREKIDKYMNYFFDVLSIQKLFPVLLLNGTGLIVKVVISLLLLLFFDLSFFLLGLFFILFFSSIVLFLGRDGAKYAIMRSDAKHEAIHYLQNIPLQKDEDRVINQELDNRLSNFVKARGKMFRVVAKQLSLTFFMEGIIMSTFFIMGAYLVFEGFVPIGEFVASEIIIISVVNSLRDFMKQIDYMYDMIEGFYKINKLSKLLGSDI